VLAQTKNALEQGGDAWKEYGKQIDAAATAQSQLSGFDDERLLQTFQNLYRATGNVNEALRLNALSANVARGRNIELEAAAQIVTKASIGQVGALRRLGIDINKNATATQALDLLQRKYAGSAATYGKTASGAFDRLKVSIENTQEIVGKALLPGLTKVTNQLNKWLANPANQQKIQDDTEKTTVAVGRLVKAFGILNRGGQAIETGLKGMFVTPLEKFVPLHVKFQQLRDDLAGINREAIAVGLSFAAASKEALTLKSAQRNDGGGGGAGNKSLIPAHVSGTAGRTPGDLGASLPFREFQLAMAAATRSRRDDEQVLRVIVATLRQRLGRAKSLKAKSEIQDALNQYQDQLNGLLADDATGVRDAADKIKQRRKDARDAAREALANLSSSLKEQAQRIRDAARARRDDDIARRSRFETPLKLQLAAARASATPGEQDDRAVAAKVADAARKALKSGNLLMQGQIDAWNTLADALSGLNKESGTATQGHKQSVAALTANLGLLGTSGWSSRHGCHVGACLAPFRTRGRGRSGSRSPSSSTTPPASMVT
jgi:ElaB/YqjD/DUF883 family membrane-anchored ribosome-binding protein